MGWNKSLQKEGHEVTESQGRGAPSSCLQWPQFSLTTGHRLFTPTTPTTSFLVHCPSLPDRKLTCRNSEKENHLEHKSTSTGQGSRAGRPKLGERDGLSHFPLCWGIREEMWFSNVHSYLPVSPTSHQNLHHQRRNSPSRLSWSSGQIGGNAPSPILLSFCGDVYLYLHLYYIFTYITYVSKTVESN